MVLTWRHGNCSFARVDDKYRITYDYTVESALNEHTSINRFGRIGEVYIVSRQNTKQVPNGTNRGRNKRFLQPMSLELQISSVSWNEFYQEMPCYIRVFDHWDNGPDVASLKGKTVHQFPAPVVLYIINMAREMITSQYNVHLCICYQAMTWL